MQVWQRLLGIGTRAIGNTRSAGVPLLVLAGLLALGLPTGCATRQSATPDRGARDDAQTGADLEVVQPATSTSRDDAASDAADNGERPAEDLAQEVTFDEWMDRDPGTIDIATGAFLMAYQADAATLAEILEARQAFDQLVQAAIDRRIVNYNNYHLLPDRTRAMRDQSNARNVVRFVSGWGFRFDSDDPEGRDPDNLFLHTVLGRRRGYCVSLSLLTAAVAQRLGVPVHAVRVPGHMYVRYGDYADVNNRAVQFEMTNRGAEHSTAYYQRKFNVGLNAIANGTYLRNLDNREIFSDACSNYGSLLFLRGQRIKAEGDEIGAADAFDRAIRWYERAIRCDPDNAQAYYNLGTTYTRLGNVQKAAENFGKAIDRDPLDYMSYCGRGRLFVEAGDPRIGFEDLARAIEVDPNRSYAFLLRGVLRAQAGDTALARDDLETARSLEPTSLPVLLNLATLYVEVGDTEAALGLREPLSDLRDTATGAEADRLNRALAAIEQIEALTAD